MGRVGLNNHMHTCHRAINSLKHKTKINKTHFWLNTAIRTYYRNIGCRRQELFVMCHLMKV